MITPEIGVSDWNESRNNPDYSVDEPTLQPEGRPESLANRSPHTLSPFNGMDALKGRYSSSPGAANKVRIEVALKRNLNYLFSLPFRSSIKNNRPFIPAEQESIVNHFMT